MLKAGLRKSTVVVPGRKGSTETKGKDGTAHGKELEKGWAEEKKENREDREDREDREKREKRDLPRSARVALPYPSSSRVSRHTITVLSRDAVRIMSGFSGVVAIDVTQLPCPFISPRSTICSVLMVEK